MNADYGAHALSVLLLGCLGGLLVWSLGFAFYLNRIHSHGWASTKRLLRSLGRVAPIVLLLAALVGEDGLVPVWILARLGRPGFQVDLARRYATGDHLLAKNQSLARHWLTRAAHGGDARAQFALAGMDFNGAGIARPDLASALGWARMAAQQGVWEGHLLAAEALLLQPALALPNETPQTHFDIVIPRLQAQADKGDAQAMFSLGALKIKGQGTPADPEGGFRMLLRARGLGLPLQQQFALGALRSTLPPDLVQRVERTQGSSGRP